MNNELQLTKKILIIYASALFLIFSFVLYINSKVYEDWGTTGDTSFNKDYLIALVIAAFVLAYGIISLVSKNDQTKTTTAYVCSGSSFLLLACYNLGGFFKGLTKAIAKSINKQKPFEFDFASYQINLFLGIVTLVFFAAIVVGYLANKKKAN